MANRVVLHRAVIFSQSRRSAVKFIRRVMAEAEAIAKAHAVVGEYVTGALARSIHSEGPHVGPTRITGRVGSSLRHAAVADTGAKPHLIFPNPPLAYMKFYWRKVGRTVYLGKVRHPGYRGKKYLERALREVALRHGMRIL
jgi:hypothetical protein